MKSQKRIADEAAMDIIPFSKDFTKLQNESIEKYDITAFPFSEEVLKAFPAGTISLDKLHESEIGKRVSS